MALFTLTQRWTRCCTTATAYLILSSILNADLTHAGEHHYTHRGADGIVIFSDTPVINGQLTRQSYSAFIREPVVANPCHGLTKAQLDARGSQLNSLFSQAAATTSVDPALLKAVARAESCFDPAAVSHAGAQGLMQLMPATASVMGVRDVFDRDQNLLGGARYLSAMLERYSSNVELALAAYNAGPGNVDKYNGIPPFSETRHYIASVKKFRKSYMAHFTPAETPLAPAH